MIVLGIETSCDETAAAVVSDDGSILANIISSQVDLHRPFGGVVPELAARNHVEILPHVIKLALAEAKKDLNEIDLVAATYGPGLASSLLVGVSMGKSLALRLSIPFCAVNHMEAHLVSVLSSLDPVLRKSYFPFLVLLVPGGHTALVRVMQIGEYKLVGETLDDAAGEALDKGAKMLGLRIS